MLLQRLNEARRMMDKLRACIVANYFANAGMTKVPEVSPHRSSVLNCCHGNWPKTAVLFFPSMLPRMTRLFWTTRPSDGSWSHRPAPLLPSTRAPRPPPWASRSRNPSRSREMNLRKTACTEKTVAGRRAGLDATRAEWVETIELIFWFSFIHLIFQESYILTLQDTFGVPSSLGTEHRVTYHTSGPESSRLYAKKTIVVGNVSKYVLA